VERREIKLSVLDTPERDRRPRVNKIKPEHLHETLNNLYNGSGDELGKHKPQKISYPLM
jgi:hypothetical protein